MSLSPLRGYRSGGEVFYSFSSTYYLLLTTLRERRKNLANENIFSFYIAGLHMSREIILKWCKTKPTIESEYMCALFESCDDHLYIYDLLRINSIIIAT